MDFFDCFCNPKGHVQRIFTQKNSNFDRFIYMEDNSSNERIPRIDIGVLFEQKRSGSGGDGSGDDGSGGNDFATRRAACISALGKAATTVGFAIIDTPHDRAVLDDMYASARAFFALTSAEKNEIAMSAPLFRGYTEMGSEETVKMADYHECIDYGVDAEASCEPRALQGANPWPRRPLAMRAHCARYVSVMCDIGECVLAAVAEALGLHENFFREKIHNDSLYMYRMLRYPPPPSAAERAAIEAKFGRQVQFGIGPHADYGCLTLLHATELGLEVQLRDTRAHQSATSTASAAAAAATTTTSAATSAESGSGYRHINYDERDNWTSVPPIDTSSERMSLVLNFGEMLQHWTRGIVRATPHRVRLPLRERFSLAFFYEPAYDTIIEPIDEDMLSLAQSKLNEVNAKNGDDWRIAHKPIHYGDYLFTKYKKSYPELEKVEQ